MPLKLTIRGLDEAFEEIDIMIRDIENQFGINLAEIRDDVVRVITEGRARMTRNGTGVDGKPLTAIIPETEARRRRKGKGDGPPLSPDVLGSSPYSDLTVRTSVQPGRLVAELSWPSSSHLAAHAEGIMTNRGLIVRNVLGLDIQTLGELDALMNRYIDSKVANRGMTARFRKAASRILGRLFRAN